jgi:hypothetical protein
MDIDGWHEPVAAVWTSVDGFTWSRVPHNEDVFGGARMHGVTVGGPGLIAVGTNGAIDVQPASTSPTPTCPWGCEYNFSTTSTLDGDAEDMDAAVWTSVDGITWSRVPHDEAVFGGANNQGMWDVTVGGPGLVAVGKDGEGAIDHSLSQVAAVWTSVDGITWSRVPLETEPGGGAMWSVTVGGPGLVAVGGGAGIDIETPSQVAAVWTSVDGITWSRVPHDDTVFGSTDNWPMLSVAAAGPGLVAVGGHVMWTSVDGITWSRLPNDDANPGTRRNVIDAGDRYVAVGWWSGKAAVSLGPREH